MIDKKHFKIRETTMYKGYIIKLRKGQAFWMGEICDKDNNYIYHTRFCSNRTEAANEAALYIEKQLPKI